MDLHKERAESDPEGSMVLPSISLSLNYNPFDFRKEATSASHRILILIMMNVNKSLKLIIVKLWLLAKMPVPFSKEKNR